MRIISFLSAFLLPVVAYATSYDSRYLQYSDVSTDDIAAVAISVLTAEGVLEGNPDGTFRPLRLLNRAEFVKIAIPLYTGPLRVRLTNDTCFADVPKDAWYRSTVCTAKALGIVQGNSVEGVPSSQWLFEPDRPVQYEEALKILTEVFGYRAPDVIDGEWYDPYLSVATELSIGLDLRPGTRLRRDQMAMLAARYLAFDKGELNKLFAAELGDISLSSSSSSAVSSAHSYIDLPKTGLTVTTTSSSISSVAHTYDSDSNVSLDTNLLLLGHISPVMASMKVLSESEPLALNAITITLVNAIDSIGSFLVYDDSAALVGRAFLDSGSTYRLSVKTKNIEIQQREDMTFYIRAQLLEHDEGGESGQIAKVQSMGIEGDGGWSNRSYNTSTTDTFSAFQTSRSRIINVSRNGSERGFLVSGSQTPIGSFIFKGETADSQAGLRVTDITFTIGAIGSVTVANATFGADGTSERHSCTVGSSTIVCSSLDGAFGSLEDHERIITLYADVAVPVDAQTAALQISINQSGDIGSVGSVTWTDGDTVFAWVPLDSPLARGTYYEQ
ncbi:MAG: S-layer homology domain-containing protein [bacterium]|nr:S-layer homology domain-containing protein [bacterium]